MRPLNYLVTCLILTLAACTSSESPIQEWKIAHQGLYHASISEDASHLLAASYQHGASLWTTDEPARIYN